jgi:hypothetical protein
VTMNITQGFLLSKSIKLFSESMIYAYSVVM